MSWNVAAWTTTAELIHKLWGEKKGISIYFQNLKADVIALQEAKISQKKLKEKPVQAGAADVLGNCVEGYESFWAFADGKGMNGVVTFAKTGLVHRAENNPFGQLELDCEGRCVVTQFSHFSLFNVYVPNGRGGERYGYKICFLRRLREVMQQWRASTKLPVVLVGDLNLTYRAEDCHWLNRRIHIQRLRDFYPRTKSSEEASCRDQEDSGELGGPKENPLFPRWMHAKCLEAIDQHLAEKQKAALEQREQMPSSISSRAQSGIGQNTSCVNDADRTGEPHSLGDRSVGSSLLVNQQSLPVDDLEDGPRQQECVWAETFTRGGATSSANRIWCRAVHPLVAGEPSHRNEDMPWLRDLILGADRMIDTFVYCNPATARIPNSFTCFDQYRNKRFVNEGNRIDFILVDPELKDYLRREESEGNIQGTVGSTIELARRGEGAAASHSTGATTLDSARDEFDSEFDGPIRAEGIRRVTEAGRFFGAPTDGGGLPSLQKADAELHFTGLPKTGIIFTPPQMSDHLAVSCVLHGLKLEPRKGQLDNATKAFMHVTAVRSIAGFFAVKKEQGVPERVSSAPTPAALPIPSESKEVSLESRKRPRTPDPKVRNDTAESPIVLSP